MFQPVAEEEEESQGERLRAGGEVRGGAQGRGSHSPFSWSRLYSRLARFTFYFVLFLLCTSLVGFFFFFFNSFKGKKGMLFSPLLGLHFLTVKISDGLLMNVFHSE